MKDQIVLVDGLMSSDPSENHGSPEALTGKGFGDQNQISVDQFLAKTVGANDKIRVLLLGANTNASGGKTMFYDAGRNLPTVSSPIDAFNTIFSGVTGSGGAAPSATLQRKRSIIDVVRGEINSLNTTLGALLSDVVHIDLIVNAFACGLTRVAAIEFGSDHAVPVNLPTLQGEAHGQFIHGGAGTNYAQLIQLEQWYAQTFVDLCNKLKAIPEADGAGTLFDNTLLVWTREMGDSVNHNQKSMPYVVSGGAGGYLKTAPGGRYLHYNSSTVADRHERLLLNILQAMGVWSFGSFGLLAGGDKTPLPELMA